MSVDPSDVTSKDVDTEVAVIRARLEQAGDTALGPLSEKLQILTQLTEFELGRWLICNRWFSGRWTHYIAYEFHNSRKAGHPLEERIVDLWRFTAFRDRLAIAQARLQADLKEGAKLLSLPCGVMADLLTLDYSKAKDYRLVGADVDPESLSLAKQLAKEMKLDSTVEFQEIDAWKATYKDEFDAISCLGLSTYIETPEKEIELLGILRRALKPGGHLYYSFRTPPFLAKGSEQDTSKVTPEEMRFSRVLVTEVIPMKTRNFRSSKEMLEYLRAAGLRHVATEYDQYRSVGVLVAQRSA